MTPRVLVVDDNATSRTLFAKRFEQLGAKVHTVEEGQGALAALKSSQDEKRPFTLIVLDIMMPGINGIDVAREMRRLGYTGCIAAATAAPTGQGRRECKDAGIDTYLDKLTCKSEVFQALLSEAQEKDPE